MPKMRLRPVAAAPDQLGELTGLPIPLAGFKGAYLLRGERAGRRREMKRKMIGEQGWERGKWRERGIPALLFPHFEP